MKYFLILSLLFFSFSLYSQEKGVSPLSPKSEIGNPKSTYAVVVGISDYQDEGIPDLRFADKDAEAFANFLRSPAGGSLDADHLKLLTDSSATTAQFDAALGWLIDESKEGDQANIYFSGHGDVETKTRSQQGFLLCWDSPPQAYVSGAYPIFFLKEVISTLSLENKAKVLVITDACRSGKLAGNSVGGSQLTSQNLSQQFANEIKILSCQPNEYSIEGEQWGGGRGAFSYYLVDGLYGMADGNSDGTVNLMELGRYLDDHVTAEVAPESQVPMTVGNRTEKLAAVFPELLAQIQKGKAGQIPMFGLIDSKGIEEEVLAMVDTTIREVYKLFKKALKDKVFLEPTGACADAYYERLIAEQKLERLHNAMRRNYAAALQDDAQQAINNLMTMEKTEVRLYRLERLDKYATYPRLLERAAELLGTEHYMYPTLQARKCYFEGQVLQMGSPVNVDSVLGRRLLDKYRESMHWQPEAAITYFAMGSVFEKIIPQPDSTLWYGQKAIEMAPGWIRAYTLTANQLTLNFKKLAEAKKLIDSAFAIDSTNTYAWASLGMWEEFANGNWKESERCFLKSIELDSTYTWAYYQLGFLYFNQNQTIKAKQAFLKASQTEKPSPEAFIFLGALHCGNGEYAEAEPFINQALKIEPEHGNGLRILAGIYFKTGRSEKAFPLLDQVITYDSTSTWTFNSIGEIYADNGWYEAAEKSIKKAIALDSLNYVSWLFLGGTYVLAGRYDEAVPILQRSLSLNPKDLFSWRSLGDAYLLSGKLEAARDTYREILNINPTSPFGFIGLASLSIVENKSIEALDFLEQAVQKGCSLKEIDKPEFSELDGFKALMKKYFPNQHKD